MRQRPPSFSTAARRRASAAFAHPAVGSTALLCALACGSGEPVTQARTAGAHPTGGGTSTSPATSRASGGSSSHAGTVEGSAAGGAAEEKVTAGEAGANASGGTEPRPDDGAAPANPANGGANPGSSGEETTVGGSNAAGGNAGNSPGDGETPTNDSSTTDSGSFDTTGGAPTDPDDSNETSDETNTAGDRCDVGVWDGSQPEPLSLTGNTFAHDPTMVEANGTFYRFWTGDRIPSATSTDLLHWENAPAAYSNSYPNWVNSWLAGVPGQTFNFPWAPDASYFNGQFHLYSSFSAKFGDNISCITHLTSDGPTPGNWTDHGPVICTEGHEPYNAIDADVELDAEGNAYLSFGSFWDGILAFPLNPDGSRQGGELTRLAWAREIEAPVLLRRCGYYYLFVTWGLCCPGEGRSVADLSYRVAVGRSEHILGPYLDREGRPMLEGGGTLLVQGDGVQWAAAGHSDVLVTGSKIYHYYHAYRQSNGQAQLRIVELPFDDAGWPIPGGP